ncbi:MAG: sigma-70 family RNA polymerase sigma factor [Verrucomicrobiota bacterium]
MRPDPTNGDLDEAFVIEISEAQTPLRSYIWKLVGHRQDVDDILQKTNVIIWKKRMDWDPETTFLKWAYRIAYFQVKAHFRDNGRERSRLQFDDSLIDLLAKEEPHFSSSNELLDALDTCLGKMDGERRDLLIRRYEGDLSVEALAEKSGRSANGLSQMLRRSRSQLSDCIHRQLSMHT